MSTRVSSPLTSGSSFKPDTEVGVTFGMNPGGWGPSGLPSFPCAWGAAPRWSRQGWGVTALLFFTGATLLLQGLCVNTVVRFLDLKVGSGLRGMPPEAGVEKMRCPGHQELHGGQRPCLCFVLGT